MVTPVYGSANKMAWEYFAALRHLVDGSIAATDKDEERRTAMLAVVHAVTVVEAFLNLWFRVKVEGTPEHRMSFLRDLKARKGLEYKLKAWPSRYLSKPLNMTEGAAAAFASLKELRNSLVHFTSSYETVQTGPTVSLHGLADITAYHALSKESAIAAQHAVVQFVAEIFRLSGVAEETIPRAMHAWIGVPPAYASVLTNVS